MDADRFDALSRALSTGHTRRRLTRLLGGLGVGGVLGAHTVRETFAALLNGGTTCSRDGQCKTGKCLSSGKCSCSRDLPTCKQPANRCKKAKCDFATKRCVITNKPDGAVCGTGFCDGLTAHAADVCRDGRCHDGGTENCATDNPCIVSFCRAEATGAGCKTVTQPEDTGCGSNRICCGFSGTCCPAGHICESATCQCQVGDELCDGACIHASCREECARTCNTAGRPAAGQTCCGLLTCQLAPEQDNPSKHRCLPPP